MEAKGKSCRLIINNGIVAICTGRVEAKKQIEALTGIVQKLQSARGVWRQSPSWATKASSASVAICTGRVEAKCYNVWSWVTSSRCNLHGACGGKGTQLCHLYPTRVAICTGRVEAKASALRVSLRTYRCNLHGACGGKVSTVAQKEVAIRVAICTGRVEAKNANYTFANTFDVAICTGRVEAKMTHDYAGNAYVSCNLHGACGGKARQFAAVWALVMRCNLHGACGGKGLLRSLRFFSALLQSARGVWRQSLGCLAYRIGSICCNLHGACGGKVKRSQERGGKLHVAICTGRAEKPNGIILRKNPRKFMQTYCIFIHLGV